jgi:hypothetical protein
MKKGFDALELPGQGKTPGPGRASIASTGSHFPLSRCGESLKIRYSSLRIGDGFNYRKKMTGENVLFKEELNILGKGVH